MRTLREEAQAEGELKARREAELLRHTERLTAVGVKLQATCSEAEAKVIWKIRVKYKYFIVLLTLYVLGISANNR